MAERGDLTNTSVDCILTPRPVLEGRPRVQRQHVARRHRLSIGDGVAGRRLLAEGGVFGISIVDSQSPTASRCTSGGSLLGNPLSGNANPNYRGEQRGLFNLAWNNSVTCGFGEPTACDALKRARPSRGHLLPISASICASSLSLMRRRARWLQIDRSEPGMRHRVLTLRGQYLRVARPQSVPPAGA